MMRTSVSAWLDRAASLFVAIPAMGTAHAQSLTPTINVSGLPAGTVCGMSINAVSNVSGSGLSARP
jgi:hypothetical protein